MTEKRTRALRILLCAALLAPQGARAAQIAVQGVVSGTGLGPTPVPSLTQGSLRTQPTLAPMSPELGSALPSLSLPDVKTRPVQGPAAVTAAKTLAAPSLKTPALRTAAAPALRPLTAPALKALKATGLQERLAPSKREGAHPARSSWSLGRRFFDRAGVSPDEDAPEVPALDGCAAPVPVRLEKPADDILTPEDMNALRRIRAIDSADSTAKLKRTKKKGNLAGRILVSLFGSHNKRLLEQFQPVVDKINALEPGMKKLSDEELQAKTGEFRARLGKGETLDDILPEAFAVVREASRRVLKLRHYDEQLLAGIALHKGMIAEQATGEGKTLAAPLAAYLNALTGEGVHIFTVNDYLAKRDSRWMGAVYRFLGLGVGLIQNGMDPKARQKEYAADVTYATANEFGFDYLRDNTQRDPDLLVQRGHAFAIVDEVDSVAIDQARTPLILSGPSDQDMTPYYEEADRIVRKLKVRVLTAEDRALQALPREFGVDLETGYDAVVDEKDMSAWLTDDGYDKAAEELGIDDIYHTETAHWQHFISQALRARHLFRRDGHYIVRDGRVLIVDEFTGRMMEGRQWSRGLHQAIEAKEGVRINPENRTIAAVTLQNYILLYKKKSGMTGTASTSAEEFGRIYDMDILSVPTHKPVIRDDMPDAVYRTEREKIRAVLQEIITMHAQGRPVLVGTVSPEKSELISGLLTKLGIEHKVLNAKHHEEEAEIVAVAGRYGAVTIATNMAGRGTDIKLGGDPHHLAVQMMQGGETVKPRGKRLIDAVAEVRDMIHYGRLDPGTDVGLYGKYLAAAQDITDGEHLKVVNAGGLAIIGTERHEARRVDLQLMGRSGRQGDPGSSRFFLSLEDKLMRLFGGDKVRRFMTAAGWPEDEPIESRLITRQVESSQAKVEARDFDSRQHVIKYDDVLNHQRRAIYSRRRSILTGSWPVESERRRTLPAHNRWLELDGTARDIVMAIAMESLDALIEKHIPGRGGKWDTEKFESETLRLFGVRPGITGDELRSADADSVRARLAESVSSAYGQIESVLGDEIMREREQAVLMGAIDEAWSEQLLELEDMREYIQLRAYGQLDPRVEFTKEAYASFDEMLGRVRERVLQALLGVREHPFDFTQALEFLQQLREKEKEAPVPEPGEPDEDGRVEL